LEENIDPKPGDLFVSRSPENYVHGEVTYEEYAIDVLYRKRLNPNYCKFIVGVLVLLKIN
jgi:hypothetical protein